MGTTTVDLPEHMEDAIRERLEEGMYTSKSELIRDALRHLLNQTGEPLTVREREAIRIARNEDKWVGHSELKQQLDRDDEDTVEQTGTKDT